MKRRLFSGAFVAALAVSALSASAIAAPNDNACFGQGRSAFASANGGPGTSNGFYISQRKGDNPEINAAWVAANCPA
jgi:hypothetical protein